MFNLGFLLKRDFLGAPLANSLPDAAGQKSRRAEFAISGALSARTASSNAKSGFTLLLGVASLCASHAWAQGIYTCVDANGRKITADRPIAECNDRTQHEMSRSGNVKRVIGPSLTAKERAEQDEKEKERAELVAKQAEDKRRNRALLLRYPDRVAHEKARQEALAQIDEVIKAATQRSTELIQQDKALAAASSPAAARQKQREEIQNNLKVQQRFIGGQEAEKARIGARFDEELTRLNQLWQAQKTGP